MIGAVLNETKYDVIVIGAGVVGLSCALALQKRGLNVKILERKSVASEASFGNAGGFAFSEIMPLAHPGIIWKAPKWLLDPMGPLSVPPAYGVKILPWMLRFLRASFPNNFERSVKAQASLMSFCENHLDGYIKDVGAEHMLRSEGQIQLFESRQEWLAERKCCALWERHGIEYKHLLGVEKIAQIQPGVSPLFTHGIFTPAWRSISDPFVYTQHLAKVFGKRGGVVELKNVTGIDHFENHICVETDMEKHVSKKLVIAAGAWSHKLASMIGDDIPLETERGYNTTLPDGKLAINTHITFPKYGFVISKIGDGVRVGGAVELGGLERPPDYKRSDFMLEKAKHFLPDLDIRDGKKWMGFRPSMPDSLPVIGRANTSSNVFYAFGHGHLGLTQSAGTGELVAQMVSANEVSIDLNPFSASRF